VHDPPRGYERCLYPDAREELGSVRVHLDPPTNVHQDPAGPRLRPGLQRSLATGLRVGHRSSVHGRPGAAGSTTVFCSRHSLRLTRPSGAPEGRTWVAALRPSPGPVQPIATTANPPVSFAAGPTMRRTNAAFVEPTISSFCSQRPDRKPGGADEETGRRHSHSNLPASWTTPRTHFVGLLSRSEHLSSPHCFSESLLTLPDILGQFMSTPRPDLDDAAQAIRSLDQVGDESRALGAVPSLHEHASSVRSPRISMRPWLAANATSRRGQRPRSTGTVRTMDACNSGEHLVSPGSNGASLAPFRRLSRWRNRLTQLSCFK
jgi:hypothetical protein